MRTGIAVIAFGFVVAQFNVFVARDARAAALGNSEQRHEFAQLFGPPGCHGGARAHCRRDRAVRPATWVLDDPGKP